MNTAVRQFDLYDFFSVLIPGLGFLFGLIMFAPQSTSLKSFGLLFPLLTGGYIAGRFLHVVAVYFEDIHPAVVSHREKLVKELKNPKDIDQEILNHFCDLCINMLEGIELYDPEEDESKREQIAEKPERTNAVYTFVRGHIHMDARGRSRTFQAVFAFHRSIWIATYLLSLIYILYALSVSFDISAGLLPYTPKIYYWTNGKTDYAIARTVILPAILTATLGHIVFWRAKKKHREFFLEYLITDFVILMNGKEIAGASTEPKSKSSSPMNTSTSGSEDD